MHNYKLNQSDLELRQFRDRVRAGIIDDKRVRNAMNMIHMRDAVNKVSKPMGTYNRILRAKFNKGVPRDSFFYMRSFSFGKKVIFIQSYELRGKIYFY